DRAPAAAAAPGSGASPAKMAPGTTAKAQASDKASAPAGERSLEQLAADPALAQGLTKMLPPVARNDASAAKSPSAAASTAAPSPSKGATAAPNTAPSPSKSAAPKSAK